jgi:uncharacterized RDD family membrane protein YckC
VIESDTELAIELAKTFDTMVVLTLRLNELSLGRRNAIYDLIGKTSVVMQAKAEQDEHRNTGT